jgi:hypothetical protein
LCGNDSRPLIAQKARNKWGTRQMKRKRKVTTNNQEKLLPHIPLKFEDAISAALQTKPEKKKPAKKKQSK